MLPKLAEFRSATGNPKFAWLSTLKISARNCRRAWPAISKSRTKERSMSAYEGPRAMLRPASPNCPACVCTSRRSNDDRLIHSSTVWGPALGSPTTFGRLAGKPEIGGLFACSATLAESETVNGVPELYVAIPFNCHPANSVRTIIGASEDICGIQLALAKKRWPPSNSDGPHSASRSNGFCARSFSPASGLAAAPERFIADKWSIVFESQYETLKPTAPPKRRDRLNCPAWYRDLATLLSMAIVEKPQGLPQAGQVVANNAAR